MPLLATSFNYGTELKNENPTLYNQLSTAYSNVANAVNAKVGKNVSSLTPPADSDQNKSWEIGDIWVDSAGDNAYILTSRQTNSQATWVIIT